MEQNTTGNLHIFNQVQTVPEEGLRRFTCKGGEERTEINTVWRIKKLTELFGPCGSGWYFENVKNERITVGNGEVCVFTELDLYVRDSKTGRFGKPIHGAGSSRVVLRRDGQLYLDDEAYKKAETDALSNACKKLGFGADIYMNRLDGKYTSGTATFAADTQGGLTVIEKNEKTVESEVPQTEEKTEAAEQKTEKKVLEQAVESTVAELVEELPELTPSHARWTAFVSWVAKKPAAKSNESIRDSIQKQWKISDENFNELLKLAGRN